MLQRNCYTRILTYTLLSSGLEGTFDVSLTSVAFIDPSPSTIWLEIALIKGVCPLIPPHRFISYKFAALLRRTVGTVLSKIIRGLRFSDPAASSPSWLVDRTFRRCVIKNQMQFRVRATG